MSHLRWGLEEYTRRAWVAREKRDFQTNYWPSGSLHTPPIPDPDALVVPIHMGGKGCNLWRWVGRLARLRTSSRQASSSSCTSAVSWTCLPVTLLRACCTRVNMPLDPETAGVMPHSSPRSLRHLSSEVECAFLGMAASAASNFYYRLGERRSRWVIVLMSHRRTLFRLDQAPSS